MTGWETPFDISMLGTQRVVIHCPTEQLSKELMKLLEDCGVKWGSGHAPTARSYWTDRKEQTCYFIGQDLRMSYGAESGTAYPEWSSGKCTFYGLNDEFDCATDKELLDFVTGGDGK